MLDKQASFSKTPPSGDNEEDMEDMNEENGTTPGCGCLWLLCSTRHRNNDSQQWYNLLQQQGEMKGSWVMKKAKKLREVSEILAGPKWKNFIRRFSIHGIYSKKRSRMQFLYDPQSYALNFDNGDDHIVVVDHHFAARFAAPLPSTL
ncbi:hypothetical protein ACSBR2_036808 [Camellia fascicularis]